MPMGGFIGMHALAFVGDGQFVGDGGATLQRLWCVCMNEWSLLCVNMMRSSLSLDVRVVDRLYGVIASNASVLWSLFITGTLASGR